ncbi:MAG: S8 family peptidase [Clostridia bacterium]|nr:S8 family peptidase [Clostridia bacterium]
MNNLLQLKGQFQHKKNGQGFGRPNLPSGCSVHAEHIAVLKDELESILDRWSKNTLIGGALVSVHYTKVVAKSNRIKSLFVLSSSVDANDAIRGAKFEGDQANINHVFTYFITLDALKESIRRLEICAEIVSSRYKGTITCDDISALQITKDYHCKDLSLSSFVGVIIDCFYVRRFSIDEDVSEINDQSIVTIYKTKPKTIELLEKLGIRVFETGIIDETTICLNPDQLQVLKEKAPYLIAMQVRDWAKLTKEDVLPCEPARISIPTPKNEPVIGVIDTLFSGNVYFSEWVKYENMLDENIPTEPKDYNHGTEVSSIIVDGPTFNPDLDDGCGRFRVRHFGVAKHGKFSSFSVLKAIRTAVAANRDIKVWNLSLGSAMQIHPNFISPEAAELDRIQSEYDVIFIVAGTNRPEDGVENMRLGAPADSINSLVVNAVKKDKQPVSYKRVGPVLSFFHKPDVSYYGGDENEKIRVCTPLGEGLVSGTSFAAPWIARKMAFLIHNLGMSREVAKALLIDSAAGWNRRDDLTHSVGYGVVPVKIYDIVQTANDEIRFYMTGTTDEYETYTYNIPVPTYMDKHPFFARATLCYFPKCSRNQGVDYTNTEMDIHFGRVREGKRGAEIKSINNNVQGNEGCALYEGPARDLYRKWDNIKHISDTIKERSRARDKYGAGLWGLSVKTKERLKSAHDKAMQFGIVITLKEMNGVNRIDDFIKLCMVRGWIVNRIDVNTRVDVYAKAEEKINFD